MSMSENKRLKMIWLHAPSKVFSVSGSNNVHLVWTTASAAAYRIVCSPPDNTVDSTKPFAIALPW